MEEKYSRREALNKIGRNLGFGAILLYGSSCRHGHHNRNKAPSLADDIERSFASNTGYVDYSGFFATDLDGEIKLLVSRYNGETAEIRDITGREENGLLFSGSIPVRISKEIKEYMNRLEVYVVDDKGKSSNAVVDEFVVPNKKSALENIVGILNNEGGYDSFLLNETVIVPEYGAINVPILIRRLDEGTAEKKGNGMSVIDYVGIGEDLEEAFGRRDLLFNAGYSGLFIIRAPLSEVNRLTAELVRNKYLSTRDIDQ